MTVPIKSSLSRLGSSAALLVVWQLLLPEIALAQSAPEKFFLGADVSALAAPGRSGRGVGRIYQDKGRTNDEMTILFDHDWTAFRLRVFVSPVRNAPNNSLENTIALAKRIKAMGATFLLCIHLSDTWADPQHQDIPVAWRNLDFAALEKQVEAYTCDTIKQLKEAGAMPDWVQVGNEITRGTLWPVAQVKVPGSTLYNPPEPYDDVRQWDHLTRILKAGIRGVKSGAGDTPPRIAIHIDKGGNWQITKWFFDHLNQAHVEYDIIAQSFYPPWRHGTLDQLWENMNQCARQYNKDFAVVETGYGRSQVQDNADMMWPATPEGRLQYMVDVVNTVKNGPRGLSVMYWAPEWDIWNKDGSPEPAVSVLDRPTLLTSRPASHAPIGNYPKQPLVPPAADLYREKYRPQFHLTARQWTGRKLNPGMKEEGWINDVNGLIYHNGQYHLFAQRWARCWLHFVSKDLVHWTELQPAFWEEQRFGTGVQSGTIVYDRENVSELSSNPKTPPLVAFWSGFDNRSQCMSFSLDHGMTWAKYANNPYMIQPERDPRVFWYEPGKKWVMVLYADAKYHIFNSTNLLNWVDQKNPVPDCFECPDLFSLPVDGDLKHTKWALVRGNGKYSIGEFDGSRFTPETDQLPCDLGANFYATQSWGDIPGQSGRRVQIAWMRDGKYPEMPFNQQLTFPCDLKLRTFPEGLRICRLPVKEIASLYGKKHTLKNKTIGAAKNILQDISADLLDVQLDIQIAGARDVGIRCKGIPVTYSAEKSLLSCLGKGAKVDAPNDRIRLRMLVDRTSIEVFANNGKVSMSSCFLPGPTASGLELFAEGGSPSVLSMTVYELKSIWPKQPN